MKNRTITTLALCTALALVLSYLESLLPAPGVPGVKLGLANLAVLFALSTLMLIIAIVRASRKKRIRNPKNNA